MAVIMSKWLVLVVVMMCVMNGMDGTYGLGGDTITGEDNSPPIKITKTKCRTTREVTIETEKWVASVVIVKDHCDGNSKQKQSDVKYDSGGRSITSLMEDNSPKPKNEMLLMVAGMRLQFGNNGTSIQNVTVGLVNGGSVKRADYPEAVQGVAVTHGPAGKVVAIGGHTAHTEYISNKMFIYDVVEDRWTSGPPMKVARSRPCSVTVGTKVYAIGGYWYKSVEVWDWSLGESSEWKNVTPMGTLRGEAGAVVYKGNIYVIGGWTDGRSGEKYMVGNDTWVPIPNMIYNRRNHGLVAFRDKIYAIGGVGKTASNILKSVESFDGHQWVNETSLNVARYGAACGVIGDKIYVVSGAGDDGYLVKSMEIFDPSTSKWTFQNTTDTSLPSFLAGHVVVDLP